MGACRLWPSPGARLSLRAASEALSARRCCMTRACAGDASENAVTMSRSELGIAEPPSRGRESAQTVLRAWCHLPSLRTRRYFGCSRLRKRGDPKNASSADEAEATNTRLAWRSARDMYGDAARVRGRGSSGASTSTRRSETESALAHEMKTRKREHGADASMSFHSAAMRTQPARGANGRNDEVEF